MKKVIIIASSVVGATLIVAFLIYYFFFTMNRLPEGDLISSHTSPNGEYTVNIYLCSGHSTNACSVRGEVVTEESGNKRNIYWRYRENSAKVEWIDDHTVYINGKKLDIRKDVYDWRREG